MWRAFHNPFHFLLLILFPSFTHKARCSFLVYLRFTAILCTQTLTQTQDVWRNKKYSTSIHAYTHIDLVLLLTLGFFIYLLDIRLSFLHTPHSTLFLSFCSIACYNYVFILSLVCPHMQITVLPQTTKHRNMLLSVFLMCIIIFYARIMSFNSKDKLDVATMHGLYCYKENDNHIILEWKSYYFVVW